MNSVRPILTATVKGAALLTALGFAACLAAPARAAGRTDTESRYILEDLGTFGGANSNASGGTVVINNHGTVVGGADTADWNPNCDCPVGHAFSWDEGNLTDLGSLPSGNNFSFAVAINSPGAIVGLSADGAIDPSTGIEAFVATLWTKNGSTINLGTFGGSFSLAFAINDRGQAVGGAENTIPDAFDFGGAGTGLGLPSPTHWHAARWQNGAAQDLGTLGGPDSFALFVNARGQIAGVSSVDSIDPSQGVPAIHSFQWENGRMVDLGTLGGAWANANAMNNRGEVVGVSATVSGDWGAFRWSHGKMLDLGNLGANFAAALAINDNGSIVGKSSRDGGDIIPFLWRNGVMTDLGRLSEGKHCNVAFSINSKEQIVGQSDNDCDGTDSKAWIWEKGGPMVDLNTLVPAGSALRLVEAQYISDRGEIVGVGVLPDGDVHAFVLIPRKRHLDADGTAGAADAAASDAASPLRSMTNRVQSPLTPQALAAMHVYIAKRQLGMRSLQHR